MIQKYWKSILFLLAIAAMVFFGYRLNKWFDLKMETQVEEDATVLMEKIQMASKLITVEGFFSEIYDYQDYYGYDFSMFRKKALLRVKAKVSIGYDLSSMKIETDAATKTVILSEIPPAELLSLEHDLDYYDLQEGIFNTFTKADYNKLNANAKDFIRQKAQESELFDQANLKKNALFEMMRLLTESSGWQLKIESGISNSTKG